MSLLILCSTYKIWYLTCLKKILEGEGQIDWQDDDEYFVNLKNNLNKLTPELFENWMVGFHDDELCKIIINTNWNSHNIMKNFFFYMYKTKNFFCWWNWIHKQTLFDKA